MSSVTTFIVADNQDITRAGISYFIMREFPQNKIVEAHDKQTLVASLMTEGNVAVVDYSLMDFGSVEEFLVIVKRFPHVGWLVFSNEMSETLMRRLSVEENICIVMKDSSGNEIRAALVSASRCERYLCQQTANMLIASAGRHDTQDLLTPTEIEVLRLIAHGLSVKEIANQRNSSIHTIITHKKNIFRKLEINNVYEATKYAIRAGLIEMAEYYI